MPTAASPSKSSITDTKPRSFVGMIHRLLLLLFLPIVGFAQPGGEVWSLQRCIDHAFEHNLTLRQARLGTLSADAARENAVGAFLPNLNGSASHGYNFGQTIDPFTNQFATSRIRSNSFGISTGLTLFNGFTNHLNLRRADLGLESAQAAIESAENDVALTIAGAYLNVLFQMDVLRVAELNRDATARQVDRVTRLVNAGSAAEADLLDVRAQLASDAANIVGAENGLTLARLNLVQLLQLPAEDAANFTLARPAESDLTGGDMPATAAIAVAHALSSFPQIRQAELSLQDAEIAAQLAGAGRMPRAFMSYSMGTGYSGARRVPVGDPDIVDVNLGTLQLGDTLSLDLITQQEIYTNYEAVAFRDQVKDNRNSSLFFSVSVPIFNNFGVRTAMKQAEINVRRQELALDQTRWQLRSSVEQAWADAKAALTTLEAQQAAVTAAELALTNAEKRYEAGAISALDYADARNRNDAAALNLLRARYDYAFKRKILDFYSGQALTFR